MRYLLLAFILLSAACSRSVMITESEMRSDLFYASNDYKPFTGNCMVVFSDTSLVKDRFTYKNGILNGETGSWYRSGMLRSKGYYENNLLTGKWEFWDEEGNKVVEANYKNDLLNGMYISYYPDGSIKEKGEYTNDKRTGEWITDSLSVEFVPDQISEEQPTGVHID